ncbi:non-specific lipid-transfer protein-like [Trifolium pratense]|uniref:Uncharacterized protein n=1 Tax=Trifolium pratense TaxID=57577 RepID=A0ACB0K5G6_TRIPR|nr:non-specific lipid-transfer protein-like [Trifolium pratense]CAJ2651448.1 unnamed protein product [Trifolium pratense]
MGKKCISLLMVVMVVGMLVTTIDASQIDDVSCQEALLSLLPCLPFLQGVGPDAPPSNCCAGANNLNQKATTTQIRRDICNCLKPAASRFGVHSDRSTQLPQLCNISLSVSFDPSIDCNSVS